MARPEAAAVANNAAWCDLVCRDLGLTTQWSADSWVTTRRSPDGYPDAVTLSPGVDADALLGLVEGGAGCSVKDSFADVDLGPHGFHVLFEASWIHHPRGTAGETALEWREVLEPAELAQWAIGRNLPVFVPALLHHENLHFFSAPQAEAGFALLRTGSVTGVSNVVPRRADAQTVWSDVVTLAGLTCPGLDLVGYEHGPDLTAALAAGFAETGPLRVWLR